MRAAAPRDCFAVEPLFRFAQSSTAACTLVRSAPILPSRQFVVCFSATNTSRSYTNLSTGRETHAAIEAGEGSAQLPRGSAASFFPGVGSNNGRALRDVEPVVLLAERRQGPAGRELRAQPPGLRREEPHGVCPTSSAPVVPQQSVGRTDTHDDIVSVFVGLAVNYAAFGSL